MQTAGTNSIYNDVNYIQSQLFWVRRRIGWTITQWKPVLWSDEAALEGFCFGININCMDNVRIK